MHNSNAKLNRTVMHSAEKMAFSPDDVSVLISHVLCPSVAEADELPCKDKNKKIK